MGSGSASVGYTEAIRAGDPFGKARTMILTLSVAVAKQVTFLSTFIKLTGMAVRLASVNMLARGVLLNMSGEEMTFHFPPATANCGAAEGPLSAILPPPQTISDPFQHREVECVAVQLFSITNRFKLEGVDAVYLAKGARGNITGFGFGIPYDFVNEPSKKHPEISTEHSIVCPIDSTDSVAFLNHWKQGGFGDPPTKPRRTSKSSVGCSTIWLSKVGLGKITAEFGLLYSGNAG